jgi:predicted Zn-dependent protease
MSKASILPSEEAPASSERLIVQGIWHPPGASREVASVLATAGTRVEVTASAAVGPASALASAETEEIEISARVGSIPRRIAFPDGSAFVTVENDAVDAWLRKRHGKGYGFVAALERVHPRLFLVVAVVIVLSIAAYRYALPAMVEVAVAVTPPAAPRLMGQSVLSSLDRTLLAPSQLDEERKTELTEGFRRLAALTPRGRDGFTLLFRRGGRIGPNAFALPDGSVILTDELVALADSDDELMGVLAHEIGHVEHEHSLRRLYHVAGISGMIMLAGGDIGSSVEDLLVHGSLLAALSYSRDQELEADRYSVALMRQAGRDPLAMGRLLERLQQRLGVDGGGLLATHPATSERIDQLRRDAEKPLQRENGR